jgi:hypothetical protein
MHNSHAHITRFRQGLQVHQSDTSYTNYKHSTDISAHTTSFSTVYTIYTHMTAGSDNNLIFTATYY